MGEAETVTAGIPVPTVSRGTLIMRRLFRNPGAVVGLSMTLGLVLVAAFAHEIAPADPFASVAAPLQQPNAGHLMGTDDLGRDLFSGIVLGARTSLTVAAAVVALASAIGVTLGAVAGYGEKIVDDVIMRITDAFLAVPRLFLAVLVLALFGAGLDRIILVLGLTSWPTLARVVRAETLSLKQRDFVLAAHSAGASHRAIIWRHILPNVMPAAVVVILLVGGSAILLEAALSFLGLGDPSTMSWGLLINNAQPFIRVAWWMPLFPGTAIVIAVLGVNLLGDALNDALNPRTRHLPR